MLGLRSQITQKLLNYFFLHPSKKLYVNEISRLLEVDRGNLVRKLKELEREGLFLSEFHGKQKYYFLNPDYPLLEEFRHIAQKTFGIEQQLRSAFSGEAGIKHLYIFGSYAADRMDAGSDIDILIVGNCPHLLIEEKIIEIQQKIHREINVIDFDEKEYQNRLRKNDVLLREILDKPHIKVI